MKSLLLHALAALSLLAATLTAAGAYEAQGNFTLSPGQQPGSTRLTAPPVPGRVYFFQVSADGLNWSLRPPRVAIRQNSICRNSVWNMRGGKLREWICGSMKTPPPVRSQGRFLTALMAPEPHGA